MTYQELVLPIDCCGEALASVLALPHEAPKKAVLIIVGGPQYRVGSHRQFVLLARHLAEAGYGVLRFDCRGMGDSTGEQRSFEQLDEDIAAAVDALFAAIPALEDVVLWGLCDGASAALLYCQRTQDPRVGGLCLLNPWVRSEFGLARTHVKHYYLKRLRQREFWAKVMSGKVALSAASNLVRNLNLSLRRAPRTQTMSTYQERMASAWIEFKGPILLLLSGNDLTAKEFLDHASTAPAWANAFKHAALSRHDLAGADHTFSTQEHRSQVEKLTLSWLKAAPPS